VSFTLQLAAVVIPVLTGYGLETVLFWLAAVAVARWIFAILDGHWFSKGIHGIKGSLIYLAFALPLMFHAFNSGLMDYIDGWIVSGYFGEDMFARYRYGARELPINALLIGGLVSGLIPRFSKMGDVDASVVRSESARLIKTIIPANCVLLLVSPLLYQLVYSEEFVLSARIFNIYALTLVSRVIIGQVYLYVFQKNWILALSTLGEIILNVVLSLILLDRFGLLGIPVATVIAYALHKVFITLYVGRVLKEPLQAYFPIRRYALASIALALSFIIAEFIYF
jgi:O-antigen/teichoic acid export membrane protein